MLPEVLFHNFLRWKFFFGTPLANMFNISITNARMGPYDACSIANKLFQSVFHTLLAWVKNMKLTTFQWSSPFKTSAFYVITNKIGSWTNEFDQCKIDFVFICETVADFRLKSLEVQSIVSQPNCYIDQIQHGYWALEFAVQKNFLEKWPRVMENMFTCVSIAQRG